MLFCGGFLQGLLKCSLALFATAQNLENRMIIEVEDSLENYWSFTTSSSAGDGVLSPALYTVNTTLNEAVCKKWLLAHSKLKQKRTTKSCTLTQNHSLLQLIAFQHQWYVLSSPRLIVLISKALANKLGGQVLRTVHKINLRNGR